MEETSSSDVGHRRANLLPRVDYIHSEGIHRIPSNVIPVHAGDQHFAFVVVHKQSTDHLGLLLWRFTFLDGITLLSLK